MFLGSVSDHLLRRRRFSDEGLGPACTASARSLSEALPPKLDETSTLSRHCVPCSHALAPTAICPVLILKCMSRGGGRYRGRGGPRGDRGRGPRPEFKSDGEKSFGDKFGDKFGDRSEGDRGPRGGGRGDRGGRGRGRGAPRGTGRGPQNRGQSNATAPLES